ncbi:hypothetical protein HMPREF3291_22870 [Bacillus sp. HMSC76G11]|uniref:DUF4179 domain-containing protein n=1 Tax=Metabacillus idriensis TaxID=324768 RepID=A0A6I2MBQ7_9BACI|nr:DUF4179 domain-containing protein [Metabacillus idriensis]MRX53203.1 DUF4179 domain-containing protein [Metabacillus idriensis]OHR71975.1 hypothetical protein HMPREF3291_22870 [Bacillus sp. HMSC76G11]
MFEREESELTRLKKKTDQIKVPHDSLDDAIMTGFQKAKRKKKRPSIKWASLAAAIFIFVFITLIRVSPAFATYVSSIPGMEKMVEIIRFNKGLMSAVENNFAQEIGVSDEHSSIKITIDSAIIDQRKLKIFYTVHNQSEKAKVKIKNIELHSGAADLNQNASFTSGHIDEDLEKNKSSDWSMEYDFAEPMNKEDFQLKLEVHTKRPLSRTEAAVFQFSFHLNQDLVEEKMKVININQTVTVQKQKITFKKAEITPLSATLQVQYDKNNTMELFAFEDLRLVDEKGEPWTIYHNGLVGREISASEDMIYLESNYFEQPKELYLEFSKIRAVKKSDLVVIVDPVTNTVLKRPQDEIFSKIEVLKNEISFTYYEEKEASSMFMNEITDANGVNLSGSSSGEGPSPDTGEKRFAIQFDRSKITKGPLSMKFVDYPGFIEEKTRIRIK